MCFLRCLLWGFLLETGLVAFSNSFSSEILSGKLAVSTGEEEGSSRGFPDVLGGVSCTRFSQGKIHVQCPCYPPTATRGGCDPFCVRLGTG